MLLSLNIGIHTTMDSGIRVSAHPISVWLVIVECIVEQDTDYGVQIASGTRCISLVSCLSRPQRPL